MFQGDPHKSLRLLTCYCYSLGVQDLISPHCHVADNPYHFLQDPPWSHSFLSKFLSMHKKDGGGEGQGTPKREKKMKGREGRRKEAVEGADV